ncbi:hypothetical protein Y032_0558g3436 [Ancylostoma ceylanicum]|uniref:Uncharacterized protein n=1 Tax=Ancylostoma ceylanicum TaxID=53326 RepID=A0A016WPL6_9BILA|nr:hypothetical protein Y032_0558g3436 [Ancylostoma ceylanicum]
MPGRGRFRHLPRADDHEIPASLPCTLPHLRCPRCVFLHYSLCKLHVLVSEQGEPGETLCEDCIPNPGLNPGFVKRE